MAESCRTEMVLLPDTDTAVAAGIVAADKAAVDKAAVDKAAAADTASSESNFAPVIEQHIGLHQPLLLDMPRIPWTAAVTAAAVTAAAVTAAADSSWPHSSCCGDEAG